MSCRMFDHVNVVVPHKGKFRRDDHGTMKFVDCEFYVWEDNEVDLMVM